MDSEFYAPQKFYVNKIQFQFFFNQSLFNKVFDGVIFHSLNASQASTYIYHRKIDTVAI